MTDGVALERGGDDARGSAARDVLALIDGILAEAGVTLADLRRHRGRHRPGSFTGLRIGIATGEAPRRRRRAAGGRGLDAAGAAAPRAAGAVAVIDARRREVFAEGPGVARRRVRPGHAGRGAGGRHGRGRRRRAALRGLLAEAGADRARRRGAAPRAGRRARRAGARSTAPGRCRATCASPTRLPRRWRGETGIELRKLKLADIPSIEQVERRAYSTPWSRTMFAGEIAKPTSRCYGAFDAERLAGYLIVSRYVDAWHIMNVAIDEPYRRRGLAYHMLEQLFAETRATARAATRSRCASRTTARSGSTSASASSRPASGAGTTPTTARTP